MKFDEQDEAEFLTTIEKWDLVELLARCGSAPNVLVAIEVRPRHAPTGLLEERGRWIHTVWDAAVLNIPDVAGHRMMWSQLLFICQGDDIEAIESRFAEILSSCKVEGLKSLCVLSAVSGDANARLIELERMFEGIGKERNFGDRVRFEHWLLDGERFPARESHAHNS